MPQRRSGLYANNVNRNPEVTGNVLRHGPDTPAEFALFRFGGPGDLNGICA
jgi:hypothetical protein